MEFLGRKDEDFEDDNNGDDADGGEAAKMEENEEEKGEEEEEEDEDEKEEDESSGGDGELVQPVAAVKMKRWCKKDMSLLEEAVKEHGTDFAAILRDPVYEALHGRTITRLKSSYFTAHPEHPDAPKKRRKLVVATPHPALVPPENGHCYLLTHLNTDAKRIVISSIDRRSLTALASTCREFRRVITSTPALRALMIPLTIKHSPSSCPYCAKRRRCNRSLTCAEGHELFCHHSCFKFLVMTEWRHDLANALCPIPQCKAPLTEYGKDASSYKGSGVARRRGVLKSL